MYYNIAEERAHMEAIKRELALKEEIEHVERERREAQGVSEVENGVVKREHQS